MASSSSSSSVPPVSSFCSIVMTPEQSATVCVAIREDLKSMAAAMSIEWVEWQTKFHDLLISKCRDSIFTVEDKTDGLVVENLPPFYGRKTLISTFIAALLSRVPGIRIGIVEGFQRSAREVIARTYKRLLPGSSKLISLYNPEQLELTHPSGRSVVRIYSEKTRGFTADIIFCNSRFMKESTWAHTIFPILGMRQSLTVITSRMQEPSPLKGVGSPFERLLVLLAKAGEEAKARDVANAKWQHPSEYVPRPKYDWPTAPISVPPWKNSERKESVDDEKSKSV